MTDARSSSNTWRLVAVVGIWAGVFHILSAYGFAIFPRALLRELTLEAYLAMIQLITLGVGMGALFAFVGDPVAALPVSVPRSRGLLVTTALAPIVFSACTSVAFLVARPTLIAEILAGGADAAQRNTGRFGRELVESPALFAFVWGAVISPLGEESFFRGALWSLVRDIVARVVKRNVAAEVTTTVLVGSAFGFLHWDMPGGLGIVRFVSALGLGLACGVARQTTRTVTAAVLLHALFNALSLATVRRWVVTETFPMKYGAPTLISAIGVVGLAGAAILAKTRKRSRTAGDTS
jgi:membrane protease YdiL (CAAX protease family)